MSRMWDASSVRVGTVQQPPLAGATVRSAALRQDDLVMDSWTHDTGCNVGDTAGFIVAKTTTGETIIGSAPVRIVSCKDRRGDRR